MAPILPTSPIIAIVCTVAAIDLIIPARNEQQNIDPLFAAIPRSLFRHIVIANNGSTDATADLARSHGGIVVDEPRLGYGSACLAALRWIDQQNDPPLAVVFLDADLADDPRSLGAVIEPILQGTADLVIACRTKFADPGALDPHQRFGSWLACVAIRCATGTHYRDLGPMRAITWTALQQLDMRDRTWGWTVEMQFKAARQHLRIVQLDLPYRKRHAGQSKISGSLIGSLRAGYKIITTIIRLSLKPNRKK